MVLKRFLLNIALSFCLILLLSACSGSETDPEAQLRETINAIQQATEAKDISEMMAHISDKYLDSDGRDIRQVRAIAQFQMLKNPKIHTFKIIKSLKIATEKDAEVSLLVAVAGTPIDGVSSLVDLRAEMMWFDLQFRYDNAWKLTAALWRPAASTDFM